MLFANLRVIKFQMKGTTKLLLTLGTVAAATGLVIYAIRRHKNNQRLEQVADEGYETAHDILFPGKTQRRKKFQYGH